MGPVVPVDARPAGVCSPAVKAVCVVQPPWKLGCPRCAQASLQEPPVPGVSE